MSLSNNLLDLMLLNPLITEDTIIFVTYDGITQKGLAKKNTRLKEYFPPEIISEMHELGFILSSSIVQFIKPKKYRGRTAWLKLKKEAI